MTFEQMILIIYICVLAFISLITFFMYGIDKNRALKGKNRIKESTLLGFSAFGGAVGALIGRILFHHKTDKFYFSLTIYLSILVEVITVGIILFIAFKGVSL